MTTLTGFLALQNPNVHNTKTVFGFFKLLLRFLLHRSKLLISISRSFVIVEKDHFLYSYDLSSDRRNFFIWELGVVSYRIGIDPFKIETDIEFDFNVSFYFVARSIYGVLFQLVHV